MRDTGLGLSSKGQAVLFEQLNQLDASLNRRNSGIGLGLTVAQKILKQHGGEIIVKSELDRGSLFVIALPAAGAMDNAA